MNATATEIKNIRLRTTLNKVLPRHVECSGIQQSINPMTQNQRLQLVCNVTGENGLKRRFVLNLPTVEATHRASEDFVSFLKDFILKSIDRLDR